MEKKITKSEKAEPTPGETKMISRKEAIKKTSLIAVSVATTMILLGSPKAQASSPAPCPPTNDKNRNGGAHNGPWH